VTGFARVEEIGRGLWRLPLRSLTLPPFDHTNAYLVAAGGEAVLVDPGAGDAEALAAVRGTLERAGAQTLKAILLTHTHPDHVAGLGAVRAAFGRPLVLVHPLELGRIAEAEALGAGRVQVGELSIEAIHSPGHSPGHLSFHLPALATALVGDVLAGEGTTWVGVPEGNMRDYLASLERLASLPLELIGPGHGPLIRAPQAKLAEVKAHRLAREARLVALLQAGPQTLLALRAGVYPSLPHEGLHVPAQKTLLAHLEKLIAEGRVGRQGAGETARYGLRG
jgi:glyoxylase-like metal-dependent hydrolase (beta-lactamase superfamily II)